MNDWGYWGNQGCFRRWVTRGAAWVALLYGALCMVTSARAQTPSGPTPLGVDAPHIALLLPTDSGTFRRHAEALRDGFLAASKIPDAPNLLIRVYPVGEDPKQALTSYQQAVDTGARLVVGPLLRGAVNAVAAADIRVPTLLLNAPEGLTPNRPNLYVVSLQLEAEARQAAQMAYREGKRSAYTIIGDGQVLRRVHQAFIETFVKLGGRNAGEFRYNASPAELDRMRDTVATFSADIVFLALDARQARTVRPVLGNVSMYATSQTYSADAATALAGVRLIDMPWLLQPDHPAVMIYPRPAFNDIDLERLYALGIDAWRIGQALLSRHSDITLDGVTGKLTLGRDRQFARELVLLGLPAHPPAPPTTVAPAAFPPATRPPAKP
jgi:outer membrane PBP1 activator LpoA protein